MSSRKFSFIILMFLFSEKSVGAFLEESKSTEKSYEGLHLSSKESDNDDLLQFWENIFSPVAFFSSENLL